jgi:predicted Holliday junction resolvase-like endonuclease
MELLKLILANTESVFLILFVFLLITVLKIACKVWEDMKTLNQEANEKNAHLMNHLEKLQNSYQETTAFLKLLKTDFNSKLENIDDRLTEIRQDIKDQEEHLNDMFN